MVDIHAARTALYRLYDDADRLLYVGITNMPEVRWAAHSLKPWWRDVARKDVTWFERRQEASEAEVMAIRGEGPVHNSMHASHRGRPDGAPGNQVAADSVQEVPLTVARALLTRLIEQLREDGLVSAFTVRGRRRAYLVTPDFYEQALADRKRVADSNSHT